MGPEFVSRAILPWLLTAGIETACIDPGKRWQNGVDESFNGEIPRRVLSIEWFRTRPEATAVIESWRQYYTTCAPIQASASAGRRHSSGACSEGERRARGGHPGNDIPVITGPPQTNSAPDQTVLGDRCWKRGWLFCTSRAIVRARATLFCSQRDQRVYACGPSCR